MEQVKNLIQNINQIQDMIKRKTGRDHLKNYNTKVPFHEKQMMFHKSQKKNRWVFGGNRSGKTECGAVEVVWLCRGIHPFRENKTVQGWVVSLSRQMQRDIAQQKILHYLHPDWIQEVGMNQGRKDSANFGVIDYILIKNVFGEISRITFKSCDQGREKFQGASLDFVWFDEEPPFDVYQESRMRVMDKSGDIFGTMTPLKGLTWVYNHIYLNQSSDSQVWSIQMEWADNPFLPEDEIRLLTSTLSEQELQSRRYGKFASSHGMVYPEFDENIHVIDPFTVPVEWYDNISIDPGLNNPLSAHWYAEDFDGNIYVIAEHYFARQTVEWHSERIKNICDFLHWHRNSNGMINALIDSASNQRTLASERSVSELFYDNGILVNTKVNKDLFSGINRVRKFLMNAEGRARLFIFKSCTNLIREIKGYYWGDSDIPIKKDDHALDELRYYLMTKQEHCYFSNNKSEIQKNKERLSRRAKNYV